MAYPIKQLTKDFNLSRARIYQILKKLNSTDISTDPNLDSLNLFIPID